jgi:menaquinone-dependent protoporphyrinogen oxidase
MARVLIVYGTTEGQTRRIAQFLGNLIAEKGHEASVLDSTDLPGDLDVGAYDAVIAAASLHIGRHQTSIVHFVHDHAAELNARPTAFLSVSLCAASDDPDDLHDARKCVDRFLADTGWQPTRIELVAGAFRYTQYDFFKRWAMKLIARRKAAPSDTSQDYELTDWAALRAFAGTFLGELSASAA